MFCIIIPDQKRLVGVNLDRKPQNPCESITFSDFIGALRTPKEATWTFLSPLQPIDTLSNLF